MMIETRGVFTIQILAPHRALNAELRAPMCPHQTDSRAIHQLNRRSTLQRSREARESRSIAPRRGHEGRRSISTNESLASLTVRRFHKEFVAPCSIVESPRVSQREADSSSGL